MAVCTPNPPVTANDGWLTAPHEPTGSWDANCDGKVEKKPPPDLSGFIASCAFVHGACVGRPLHDLACGEKAALYDKCQVAKTPVGTEVCRAVALKGEIVQACR